jgi:hypothetical protein
MDQPMTHLAVDGNQLVSLYELAPSQIDPSDLRLMTAFVWPRLRSHHLEKIVWIVVREDCLAMFWFLVDLGLDLRRGSVRPVELAIRADAPSILDSLAGKLVYSECVKSTRLVIEAMHRGNADHLARLLRLGAPMDEFHPKYGTALQMSLFQGL